MRKITAILSVTAIMLSLTACANNKNGGKHDYESVPLGTQSSEASHVSFPEADLEKPFPFPLFGADGVQIKFGDISEMYDQNGEPLAYEKLEDTVWNKIICDNFAYIAEHPETILNSIDNADRYDSESGVFSGVERNSLIKYKRYNVGDKIGSLTLTSAKTTFSRAGYNDKSGPLTTEQIREEGTPFAAMLKRCDAAFDGELTMTGYIHVKSDEYGIEDGTVVFLPCEDCPLPVMNFHVDRDTDSIVTPLWPQSVKGLSYVSEYPVIRLGNIHRDADMSGFPTDGTSTKVKITIIDISMFSDMDMMGLGSVIDGRIVDITAVD